MRVDLPAPFSPQIACTSPRRTSRVTSCSALTPGNSLVIWRISRMWGVSSTFSRTILAPVSCAGRRRDGAPRSVGGRRPGCAVAHPGRSSQTELLGGVEARLDEGALDGVRRHDLRLEEVRRHDLDAVVVALGVVDLVIVNR